MVVGGGQREWSRPKTRLRGTRFPLGKFRDLLSYEILISDTLLLDGNFGLD